MRSILSVSTVKRAFPQTTTEAGSATGLYLSAVGTATAATHTSAASIRQIIRFILAKISRLLPRPCKYFVNGWNGVAAAYRYDMNLYDDTCGYYWSSSIYYLI